MILTIKNINSDKIVNGDVVAVIVIIIILKVKIIGFDNALVIAISESKLHVPILTSEVDIVGYDMRDGAACYIKKKYYLIIISQDFVLILSDSVASIRTLRVKSNAKRWFW